MRRTHDLRDPRQTAVQLSVTNNCHIPPACTTDNELPGTAVEVVAMMMMMNMIMTVTILSTMVG